MKLLIVYINDRGLRLAETLERELPGSTVVDYKSLTPDAMQAADALVYIGARVYVYAR